MLRDRVLTIKAPYSLIISAGLGIALGGVFGMSEVVVLAGLVAAGSAVLVGAFTGGVHLKLKEETTTNE